MITSHAKIVGSIVLLTILILVGGIGLISTQQKKEATVPEDQIISKNGIHWHPRLALFVQDQELKLENGIGLGSVHQPMHTHDEDYQNGVVHMEMDGLVTKEETKLAQFFKIWGKPFNFGGQNIKMTVNGQENTQLENFLMNDGDKIEIKYD